MKKTLMFLLPVEIEYDDKLSLLDAIKQIQEFRTEVISAGMTNFEYKSKRPRLLKEDHGRTKIV